MDAPPLVSIVVLNFNGERVIGRCLEHLLAQTYRQVEVVVVDNGSRDGSRAILEHYDAGGRVRTVYSDRNLGCAGGRNLGLSHARGRLIALMDNDGYASPTWLEEAVSVLDADPRIGAVASVVFFNGHKIILNGAGGTLNRRGYGGDHCFKDPFEFVRLPSRVLYPMGCGTVVRRAVLDGIGSLDDLLLNYFDDVEIGLWTWRMGYEVVVAPKAWVDHDYGFSEEFNRNKVLLCERNRIRTVLKYFPLSHLPPWLLRELLSLMHVGSVRPAAIPYRAWWWNLRHLPSALRRRRRFTALAPFDFRGFLQPTWGEHPPPRPNNHLNRPSPAAATERLEFNGNGDAAQVNYGWYPVEHDGRLTMRWTSGAASLFVRVPASARQAEFTWRAARADQQITLRLRRVGELAPVWEAADMPARVWSTQRYPCCVAPGVYELQLVSAPLFGDPSGRALGVGVARVAFA